MSRPHFHFQTKLMVAIMAIVVLVTLAVVKLTERKVRQTYQASAEAQFAEQVERITELRRLRLEGAGRLLERISELPEAQQLFANGKFSEGELGKLQKSISDKFLNRNTPGIFHGFLSTPGRVILAVDPAGQLHPISGMKRTNRAERKAAVREFSDVNDFAEGQYGYLLFHDEEGTSSPLEVIISPVFSETDELVGALLTGQLIDSARGDDANRGPGGGKGPGPREFERSTVPLISAMYVGGRLFFHEEDQLDSDGKILSAVQSMVANPDSEQRIAIGDKHYRIYTGLLTSENATLPPSYQVILYPLDDLLEDLKDLRFMGTGIGLVALLLGLALAWVLSRNIARPILELAAGTREISRGVYETRVAPRGEDEIGQLARSFNEMAEGLEMREQLRDVLGKVSDVAVAQALIEGDLELGGESRNVSILFCDIRGFTSLTETMPPSEVIDLVNQHMTAMTEIVYRHQGVVDKFVGDEIMAIFGAPKSYEHDAANAVSCAREMLARRAELNRGAAIPLNIGIGVATGEVTVGCMGSVDRLNYTVLGERVNRAARLCSVAGVGEAIVDEETVSQSGDQRLEPLPAVRLKGYSADLAIFKVAGFEQNISQEEKAALAAN